MGVLNVGGAEKTAPIARQGIFNRLASAKTSQLSEPKTDGANGCVEGVEGEGSDKVPGIVAVPFKPGVLKHVLTALITLLGGGDKANVCQTPAEVNRALEGESEATMVIVNPTTWDEWDTIYDKLYQKSKEDRVYLLDNSVHASDCSEMELAWNQTEGRFEPLRNMGAFY